MKEWWNSGPVFSYKLRYIVGFWLVETSVSTNQKPTMYRNLYENTGPGMCRARTNIQDKQRKISEKDLKR